MDNLSLGLLALGEDGWLFLLRGAGMVPPRRMLWSSRALSRAPHRRGGSGGMEGYWGGGRAYAAGVFACVRGRSQSSYAASLREYNLS